MENHFHMMYCRFHIEDERKLFLGGFWEQRRRQDTAVIVSLDYTPLDFELEERQAEKIPIADLHTGALRERMFFWITLPEDYRKYESLRVFERDETQLRELFSVETRGLQRICRKIPMCVDEVAPGASGTVVRGWCIAKEQYEIRVYDKKGREVVGIPSVQRRPDVEMAYPESNREWVHGFVLDIPQLLKGKIRVTVCCDGREETVKRSVIEPVWKKAGRAIHQLWQKTKVYYQQFGFRRTYKRGLEKLFRKERRDYETYRMEHRPNRQQLEKQRREQFPYMPVFGIVVPLYRTPLPYLEALVESVREQTYAHWNLYLSDGSGAGSSLSKILAGYAAKDARIHVIENEESLLIAENTNRALREAKDDYIVFADHDDTLSPEALYECALVLNQMPETDLIYSDEDKMTMDGEEFYQPHFKPDFNIDYLRSINYINHLCVVKRALIERVGLLSDAYNGAQDYDLILRCIEQSVNIYHIPKVLYHWRMHPVSVTGEVDYKSSAYEAGKRAILAHYERVGIDAEVEVVYPGIYRSRYHWKEKPLVSIIIPNKDQKDTLKTCIESLEQDSTYRNFEILLVENNSQKEETFAYYKEVQKQYDNIRLLTYEKEFNYADIQNVAAVQARGDYLLLLNNDTWLDNPDSIGEMLGYCMRKDVGIVGAKLLYPDDRIQHAGVVVGFGGVAGHAFLGEEKGEPGYFCRILCAQDYSAVTAACMMVKRTVYEEVGGMDTELKVAFNDVDFCLRVKEAGWKIVYQPAAVWYHDESKTRGAEDTDEKIERFRREIEYFQRRWGDFLRKGDPAYNPNLALDRHDFALKGTK